MSRRRSVDEWRRAVYRSTTLSDRCKVLLLFLADNMRQDRTVSIPRQRVAAALGRSERRITERITEAHDAGWLFTRVRGQKGITAVYLGLFPNELSGTDVRPLRTTETPFSGTPTSPLNSAETRPLKTAIHSFRGTHGGPANRPADPLGATADRNISKDEHEACRWHGAERCPEDCADHPTNRQESA